MNAFVNAALILALLFVAGKCGKEAVVRTPGCVQAKILEISSEDVWNPPAKIFSYSYNGQTVYFIPQRCCDIPSQLLDANCDVICAPNGGFTGGGDGSCADFFNARTDEKLLWKDNRGK